MRKKICLCVFYSIILLFFPFSIVGSATTQRVIDEATRIGSMYNCVEHYPNAFLIAGNVGYSFVDDEMVYSYAKLLNEKGCNKPGGDKYVIFYVSTVNFPSNGVAQGTGSDVEQGWLDYWDYTARRFSDLGYKIIVTPSPFIINDNIQNLDYPTGLRPLIKSDLNMNAADVPVVYRCRAGESCTRNGVTTTDCVTTIASIYDTRTMTMGINFYTGIKNFFSKYPAFTKISVVPPSDFGEYGFPFGVEGRWWEGSASVGGCYKMGDQYASLLTYSYNNYNQKLIDFMSALAQNVKSLFPGKRYMVYMGYGNDDNPKDGFSYASVVDWAKTNGVDLHSSHAGGADFSTVPLDKIVANKPAGYEFTFENYDDLNEFRNTKVLYHASKYGTTGIELYPQYLYDDFYLTHLLHSMGPSARPDIFPTKGITFATKNGLASLRSSHLVNGWMDAPADGATINGDEYNMIGGWAYYNPPLGDHQIYGVKVYAGPLIENSQYYVDSTPSNPGYSQGKHPEFMRLVASTITNAERAIGNGDLSRFGALWKPNLASGKVVMRIYIVDGSDQIMAEHPQSPLIISVNSRVSGSASLTRNNYNYGANNVCGRSYTMTGTATDSQRPGQSISMVIIDEYRGRVLAEGSTSASGSFSISFTVSNSGGETQVITPRAYVDTGTDLIALPTNPGTNVGGGATLANKFMSTLVNCNWNSCLPNPCTSPPPPACSGDNMVTYSLPSTCTVSGNSYTCSYQSSSYACPFGCNGATNQCNPDPCLGITCGDTCEGETRKTVGSCSGGTCNYQTLYDCNNNNACVNSDQPYAVCVDNQTCTAQDRVYNDYTCSGSNCVLSSSAPSASCPVSYSGCRTCQYGCRNNSCIIIDINNDGTIDIADISAVAAVFGETASSPDWNAKTDVIPDGQIDIFDIVFVASRFS
jgi:hypothetical protein